MRTALLVATLLWSSLGRAANIIVPDDHATIQAAIDAATSFDTIQVRPGTYPEALVIPNRTVVIEGLGGDPVVAPGPTGRAFFVKGDVASLTLRDVDIDGARIGVLATVSRLELERVDITHCVKGVIVTATYLVIGDSSITGCSSLGLRASGPHPYVVGLTASNNAGGGAKIKNKTRDQIAGSGTIQDSLFNDNGGSGLIYIDRYTSSITGSEASRNGKSGFYVVAKLLGVGLDDNQADDNGLYGFRTRGEPYDEATIIANGNSATGNGVQDYLIQ